MLEPTNLLLKSLNKFKTKAVFFVDTLSLLKMQKFPVFIKELNAVNKQLQSAFDQGHYIFPHLHTHWENAKFIQKLNQFDLSNKTLYSANALLESEINLKLKDSITYLKQIVISYESLGYRAGGWCIQPFAKFKNAFIENKINSDFSLLPGYKNNDPLQYFDFETCTLTQPICFNDEIQIPIKDGKFIEYPISAIKLDAFTKFKDKLFRKYLWKTNDRGFGDGLSAQSNSLQGKTNHQMISIDNLTKPLLNSYISYLNKNDYMHWISHPKMFTKHGLKCFEQFLNFANEKYTIEYNYKNIKPISI
jgi:hypothetical protein